MGNITRISGVQEPLVKTFFADGGIDTSPIESAINTFISNNPGIIVYDLDYQFIQRTEPNPDLYTHVVIIIYKIF